MILSHISSLCPRLFSTLQLERLFFALSVAIGYTVYISILFPVVFNGPDIIRIGHLGVILEYLSDDGMNSDLECILEIFL
jgi:hypothetical protein